MTATPRIKKAYRHFNAFLQFYQCRRSFWMALQNKANDVGQTYSVLKMKLLWCNSPQDWILNAFHWDSYPLDGSNLKWCDLSRLWDEYCCTHKYFI